MESDKYTMSERYRKLMKDVDENYKLIEQETQEHFIDFLDKWKAVARNKIEPTRRMNKTIAKSENVSTTGKTLRVL